jgi:hypothetical protein
MGYHTRPPSSTPFPKSGGCVEKRFTVHRSLNRPISYLLVKIALDSVPHQCLLKKLKMYGIKGKTLDWIEAFLQPRTM